MTPAAPVSSARPARRALWAVAFFALGILLSHHRLTSHAPSLTLFAAGGALALAALAVRGRPCRAALAASAVALGAAWHTARTAESPSGHLAPLLHADSQLVTIEGYAATHPRARPSQRGPFARFGFNPTATRFELAATHIALDDGTLRPAHARLWVRIDDPAAPISAGQHLRLSGFLSPVRAPGNPGQPDAERSARQRSIAGGLSVPSAGLIAEPSGALSAPGRAAAAWAGAIGRLRSRASTWLEPAGGDSAAAGAPDHARALLAALLLGQREDSLRDVNDAFTRTGIVHLLSISGMHLAIVAWFAAMAVRLTGERPRLEPIAVIAIVLLYALLVPARAPILRAAIMIVGWVVAEGFGRRYDRLNTLGWVALLVLLWRPMELFSAGFQLSFAAVAALVTMATPLRLRLFGERPQRDEIGPLRSAFESLKDAAAASLCAWAATAPLAAYHTGHISLLGAPATLLMLPAVSLMLGAGLIVLILSTIRPDAAEAIAPAVLAPADAAAAAAFALDRIPWTSAHLPALSVPLALGATALVCWWLLRGSWRQWPTIAATALLALWLCLGPLTPALPRGAVLRLDTLDVGDGSCHLIRSGPDAVLYDCGSDWLAIGERELPSALRALGVWRIRTVVISHPDLDHFGALPDLLRPLGVRQALVGESFVSQADSRRDGPAALLASILESQGVSLRVISAGESLTLGACAIEALSPAAGAEWRSDNDSSLVLLVRATTGAGERTLLMTGDIERDAMRAIALDHPDLRADAMEAPHHGSARSFAYDFVERIDPRFVVQSTGMSRAGDPRWDHIRPGRAWLCTATDGAATIEFRRDGTIRASGYRSGTLTAEDTEAAEQAK